MCEIKGSKIEDRIAVGCKIPIFISYTNCYFLSLTHITPSWLPQCTLKIVVFELSKGSRRQSQLLR